MTSADEMSTSARLRQAETDRDLARAELATATAELEQLRAELAHADAEIRRLAVHRLDQLRGTALPVFDPEYPR